jgi:hypothetical protein
MICINAYSLIEEGAEERIYYSMSVPFCILLKEGFSFL